MNNRWGIGEWSCRCGNLRHDRIRVAEPMMVICGNCDEDWWVGPYPTGLKNRSSSLSPLSWRWLYGLCWDRDGLARFPLGEQPPPPHHPS